MKNHSIAFHHFGCKVNFAEASALSRQFKERGFQIRNFRERADVYVISTCVVTAVAEKKCRAAIRQAHKLNPEGKIAVIGCFPELSPGELEKMEGVSIVLGHSGKFSLPEAVEKLFSPSNYGRPHLPAATDFIPSWSYGDRTRSFLKIQDGCDYYCSYCTIPLARGHSRSDRIENVIRNTKEIAQAGIKEIVLTGVNIGDFGRHNNESFTELAKALKKVDAISRIRISSIEPDLLNDEIIDLVASSGKFMPHFHIPLQSGSDKVLKLMKRKYDTKLFVSRIRKIRELLPLACIATDVIVGFPGETDSDFRESYEFIEKLELSYMHVFSYSRRENTLASKMPEPVQDKIKKERSQLFHKLSELKKNAFYLENKGSDAKVLFEGDNSGGFMHGFTENYIKVRTKYNPELVNQIVEVKLDTFDEKFEYMVTWAVLQ
jgi:threonylcarbamoyladenosine tRNA methylthiotransferase MtaB